MTRGSVFFIIKLSAKNLAQNLLTKGLNDLDARKTPLKLTKREQEILSIVRDNSEGITLPETVYILNTASVMISKHMKKLLTLGLIKKKENRYFLDKMDE